MAAAALLLATLLSSQPIEPTDVAAAPAPPAPERVDAADEPAWPPATRAAPPDDPGAAIRPATAKPSRRIVGLSAGLAPAFVVGDVFEGGPALSSVASARPFAVLEASVRVTPELYLSLGWETLGNGLAGNSGAGACGAGTLDGCEFDLQRVSFGAQVPFLATSSWEGRATVSAGSTRVSIQPWRAAVEGLRREGYGLDTAAGVAFDWSASPGFAWGLFAEGLLGRFSFDDALVADAAPIPFQGTYRALRLGVRGTWNPRGDVRFRGPPRGPNAGANGWAVRLDSGLSFRSNPAHGGPATMLPIDVGVVRRLATGTWATLHGGVLAPLGDPRMLRGGEASGGASWRAGLELRHAPSARAIWVGADVSAVRANDAIDGGDAPGTLRLDAVEGTMLVGVDGPIAGLRPGVFAGAGAGLALRAVGTGRWSGAVEKPWAYPVALLGFRVTQEVTGGPAPSRPAALDAGRAAVGAGGRVGAAVCGSCGMLLGVHVPARYGPFVAALAAEVAVAPMIGERFDWGVGEVTRHHVFLSGAAGLSLPGRWSRLELLAEGGSHAVLREEVTAVDAEKQETWLETSARVPFAGVRAGVRVPLRFVSGSVAAFARKDLESACVATSGACERTRPWTMGLTFEAAAELQFLRSRR